MPLSVVDILLCESFVVLALVACASSGTVPVGLDIGPAGPGMAAKLLAVEKLQWFYHVRSQLVTSVSLGKSGGMLLS